ncbi:MAG: TraR/DksA family transcriptional regulator [Bacteroidetes bacterium]|nr:MAG: TraR/DksA family transcriptional regulator [Bacteroidota bacterium]
MTDADRAYFREKLEAELERLRLSLAVADPSADSITPDNAIGRLTRMEALQAQSMSAATRARQQKRLRLLAQALERIADGTYGQCIRCGRPIPRGRLEVMPEARVCIACAR